MNNNIPQLRFPEFDDEWEKKRLNELTTLITKGTTPQKFENSGVNYVKIEGLDGININKDKCLYISETVHNKELKRSILKENDILFAIAGATIGKVGIVTKDILPANTNQALSIIRLKNIELLEYTLQILQSRVMKKYIKESISVGAQPNLNLEQMGNFSFFLPTLPEQKKIASFLTAVDSKLQALKKKKALLEEYKKGIMQKIFSQEIRFKDDNGNEFSDWKVKKLGEVCYNIKSGKSKPSINGNYPLYGSTGIIGNCDEASNKGKQILIARVGANAGFVNIVNDIFGVTDNTLVIELKEKIEVDYIYFFLLYFKLNRLVFGSGQPLITGGQLKSIRVNLPSLEEQTKTSNFLTAIDQKIEHCQTQIDNTEKYKKGLLQKMFV